ncbi:Leo1-like protein [Dictyocaulus viviparus]|uniref:Leo1-like protein n=1 Tax=Dictyocaulus viviparus TaxID=29172 RepID=A0A0D8XH43_DICVI|nr:Leo1-like protein [Dictyocaulus viviparus]
MSDSGSLSDENERKSNAESNQRHSTNHESDSTPSHRSHNDELVDEARDEESEKSDSDQSSVSPIKTRKSLINDSSADEVGETKENDKDSPTSAANIFGVDVSSSDSDDERGDAVKKKTGNESDGSKSDMNGSDDSIRGIRMYPEIEEEAEKEMPPTIIEIPNFFSVALRPFDPQTYEEDEDDDQVDDDGRNRLKLKAENTIRWRFAQDEAGNIVKESNSKIVKWSDGSMSMVIGKEVFDVESVPIYGNMQHLFVRQGTSLVAQKIFDRKLIFRPHSTDSETHRKVTMNMAERTRKSGQVRMVADVGSNPEQARREAVRREEEALRAAIRKETQQRRTKDRHRSLPNYLEGRPEYSDEEPDVAPRSRRGIDAPLIGASDSDDNDTVRRGAVNEADDSDEEFRKKKQQQKKKIVTSDEESN